MSDPVFDADAWIRTAAPALGLDPDPAWLGEIAFHLNLVGRAAALVAAAPPDMLKADPAPVYTPGLRAPGDAA